MRAATVLIQRAMRAGLVVAGVLGAGSASVFAQPPSGPPDLILFNGVVWTVDAAFSRAEAVAVRGERIVGVGTSEAMQALAGPETRTIDLGGRALIPGLMDNHLHNAGGGPGVDLSRTRSLGEVLDAIRARAEITAPDGVVVSNSDWHEAQLSEQRLPLRDDLDRASPERAVVVVRGGHEYILNSAALRRFGINEKTAVPAGGRITRYPDGRLNGELVDTAKALAPLPSPPETSREDRLASKREEYARLNAAGLTTVRHPGISVDVYRLLEELKNRGELTMHVSALLRPRGSEKEVMAALEASGLRQGEGDAWLRVGGVKLAVDGGFEGGLMREPYAEPWGESGTFKGLQTLPRETFEATVRALNLKGWRVSTHAVGDAAIDLVLDAYEAADKEKRIVDRRWSIEHAFIGRRDHLPRMRDLGLALSLQDHLYLAGPSLIEYWGRERAALTTPVRLYLDAGLQVSSGTDAPVIPYPPLWTLYHFATRDTISGGVLGPEQRVSRAEALRMATMGNAWLMMEESVKGSIEVGKLADLVVLSEDPITCADQRLRDAQVLMTIVSGRVVHAVGAFREGGS